MGSTSNRAHGLLIRTKMMHQSPTHSPLLTCEVARESHSIFPLRLDEVPFSEHYPVHELKLESEDAPWVYNNESFGQDIPKRPARLWIQGSEKGLSLLPRLARQGLAIVGTRNPQPRCLELIRRTLANSRNTDLIVVSGFARGIDACAHEEAVRNGIPTVAVLGTSLEKQYPREHHDSLRRQILESDGLMISEMIPSDPHAGFQFLKRNRLIAGLSLATWVVQAEERSGALNTAEWAQRLGRSLFVTPCFPEDVSLAGNQRLLSDTYAQPFFDQTSLASVWLEFASSRIRKKPESEALSKIQMPLSLPFESALCRELFEGIAEESEMQGGVDLFLLQTRYCQKGVGFSEFFEALQSLLNSGRIINQQGVLLKNPKKDF